MNRTVTLILGVILGFVVGMVFVYIIGNHLAIPKFSEIYRESNEPEQIKIGMPAPNFQLESLNGTRTLDEFKGKIVLLNFWATWCGPCRIEMPLFQTYYDEYQEDLVILAINQQDTKEDIKIFMDDLGLTFDALLDLDGIIHKQYIVRGYPTTIFLNRDGKVEIQHIGLITEKQLIQYLEDLGL